MNGRVGKKTKFYIGYLRNENVFVLYNADYYMGLFIKIIEPGLPRAQAGWIRVMNGVPGYRGRISQAQYNKCTELGIEIPEYNVLWQ